MIDDHLIQKFPQIFDASACDDMIRLQIAGVMKDKREEIMINGIRVSIILSLFHISNATSAQTCPKMLTTSSRLANMHSDVDADLNFWI